MCRSNFFMSERGRELDLSSEKNFATIRRINRPLRVQRLTTPRVRWLGCQLPEIVRFVVSLVRPEASKCACEFRRGWPEGSGCDHSQSCYTTVQWGMEGPWTLDVPRR
jgi:hypothetical protein